MYSEREVDLITFSALGGIPAACKYSVLIELKEDKPDYKKIENLLIKSLPPDVYNNRYWTVWTQRELSA